MAKKPASTTSEAPKGEPRSRTIDALMHLAAEEPWDMISLSGIAEKAGLSLGEMRDLFPSKGAILGSFVRRIDRIVLDGTQKDMSDEAPRERVLDVMMRRFDALMPYRAALRSITLGMERDPLGLLALNQQGLNSWRYMLEAAGIETNGPLGAMKVQGAIVVFARAFKTFLDEEDPALTKTMAALDKELARGEWVLARAEGLNRLAAPFRGFMRAACDTRRRARPNDERIDPRDAA
ncbi:MAG: TetR/AcrR family transcriptional regulator [Rhizobiales bacterium]|nr:TetR/AcrR family transcriptional regulator [Hyphomicrobiales bacterium]